MTDMLDRLTHALLDAALDGLQQELGLSQAMVLIADTASGRLYTVGSRGYPTSGVGSEIAVGHGVIGVAAREGTPVRINHMTSAARYNQALADSLGRREAGAEIPYPGLARPGSQLAVPLLSAGRVLGVLFVESEHEMHLNHEDEDLLVALAGWMALVARSPKGWRTFGIGWAFGVGHFVVGLNWIATAFTYQAAMPAWLGWIAVVLLALYLAVYPAITAWCATLKAMSNCSKPFGQLPAQRYARLC